jgi:hypothetical protein
MGVMPVHRPHQALAQVHQQVEAISHLVRLGCAPSGALDLLVAAVSADDLDLGTLLQPGARRIGRPLGEQIHRPATLPVADDRAVALAWAPGRIIDAQDAHRALLRKRGTTDPPK